MVARNCDSAQFVVDDRVDAVATARPAGVVVAVVGCPVGTEEEDDGPDDAGADEAAPDEQAARPKMLMATSVTAVPKSFMALAFMRVE
jgi:hypothetical protein